MKGYIKEDVPELILKNMECFWYIKMLFCCRKEMKINYTIVFEINFKFMKTEFLKVFKDLETIGLKAIAYADELSLQKTLIMLESWIEKFGLEVHPDRTGYFHEEA